MLTARKEPAFAANAHADSRRELLNRVLASPVFEKTERLSTLLLFVCDMTLQGREKELNEQRIGEAVFGRSPDYDSSIDGIVRTQASRLRTRLDLYFNGDGAKEPVRIVIPRGAYIPAFEPQAPARNDRFPGFGEESQNLAPFHGRQNAHPDARDAARHDAESPHAQSSAAGMYPLAVSSPARWYASSVVPWMLVAVLSIAGLGFALRHRFAAEANQVLPATNPIWSQMFSSDKRTLIVPADSGLVMWQGLMGRNIHLAEYLSGEYRTQLPSRLGKVEAVAAELANRRYTSIVDLETVQALTRISQSINGKLEVRYARDVRPNDLKQCNVILIGAAEATPWVELYEPNMNFYFYNNRDQQIFSVLNRTPQANEPRQWDSSYNDPQHRVYGVAAFLPNFGGNGNVLILEGTSMAGTESAWDFVSDDSQLLPFLKRIQRPDGMLSHFEVVLETSNMSGSAVKDKILAWRVLR